MSRVQFHIKALLDTKDAHAAMTSAKINEVLSGILHAAQSHAHLARGKR